MSVVTEREEILNKWTQTIKEFRNNYESWEKGTLKQYISKCIEILELQIKYQVIEIEKQQISSYLFNQLTKEGIHIAKSYYSEIVPDDYKRNYSESSVGELRKSNWVIISDGDDLIEKDQFDHFRINGVEVTEKKQPKESPDVAQTWDSSGEPIQEITEDGHSKLLLVYSKCGSTIERIFDALRSKYFDGATKEIQDYYKDVAKLTEESVILLSKLQNSKSLLDDRNKWGDYEKIMMNFMIKTGETTAHLAKGVGYCSKYGSIGIDRNDDVDFVDNEELKAFLRACPSCHKDIAETLNQNLQLYHLGKELTVQVPKIK